MFDCLCNSIRIINFVYGICKNNMPDLNLYILLQVNS